MGSSYLPSDLLAAYLYAQLESWQKIQEKRKRIWEHYHSSLRDWSLANTVRQPVIPEYCDQAYHMYYLLLPSLEKRQEFIARLKEANILSVFHYLPLHLSEMGLRFGGKPGQCPHTEDLSDRLVRLPFYYSLEKADLDRVIETILSFRI
jgi:dTDP-4-amino-4,6-dideoxygalactose transaminase